LLLVDVHELLDNSSKWRLPSAELRERLIQVINDLSEAASKAGIMVFCAERERRHWKSPDFARAIRSDRLKIFRGHDFTRPRKDAFSYPELDEILAKYGIGHLFLAGLEGVTSIKQTARSALNLGYRVTFIQDCIYAASESQWERLLRHFESAAAFVITSGEFADFASAVHRASETQRTRDEEPSHTPAAMTIHS
jgi:nicotinamidase-related amidase